VRVVPNKFPAFGPWSTDGDRTGLFARKAAVGRQEVVVHTPRHVESLAELSTRELARVAEAWQARALAAREVGFPYVQALVNEGRGAGASLLHTHSQLFWLEDEPPLVAQERREQDAAGTGACLLCEVLEAELEQRIRVVDQRAGLVLLCPFAGRQPYEMLVAPLECEPDAFTSARLAAALSLLAEALRRLRLAAGSVAVNAWLHDGGHWHLELLPRISVLAGLELGASVYVNTLAPEEAAERLRSAQ
jgi:UDPglucose--hexose-1-phosphate uridylyltransferase